MVRAMVTEAPGRGLPELAVAIVHFQAEELLARCVSALRRSTLTSFAAVVVDHGSRRDLQDLVDDPRFRILGPGRNRGFAAGTNLAIETLPKATPWILLVNPDVVVEPDTLETTVRVLERDRGVGAVTCRLELPRGEIDPACRRSEPTLLTALAKQLRLPRLLPGCRSVGRYNLTFLDPSESHEIDAASGAFLMLRREAWEAAGARLDERFFLYGEDLDLCRRIREAGYRILYTPASRALHVKGSGRIRSAATTAHFYRAMWLYYRKWGRFRSNPLVLAPLAVWLALTGALEASRNAVERLLRR